MRCAQAGVTTRARCRIGRCTYCQPMDGCEHTTPGRVRRPWQSLISGGVGAVGTAPHPRHLFGKRWTKSPYGLFLVPLAGEGQVRSTGGRRPPLVLANQQHCASVATRRVNRIQTTVFVKSDFCQYRTGLWTLVKEPHQGAQAIAEARHRKHAQPREEQAPATERVD